MKIRTLIVTYLMIYSLPTLACDCIVYSDPKAYLSEVDIVFTGTDVELILEESEELYIPEFFDTIPGGKEQWKAMNPDKYLAKVRMIDHIKGGPLITESLFFSSEFSNCDPIYELNQSYLFFADQREDGMYQMAHCTPWGRLEVSEKIIEELRNKKSS